MAMSGAAATAVIAKHRPADAIVISTMSTLRSFPRQSPSDLNLSCVPLMGGAAALGLGIAVASPNRSVLVLDGDGSLLMQLGALATVAGAQPENLTHFVFDNGVWFEGGADLPLPTAGKLDWPALAAASGYAAVHHFSDESKLDAGLGFVLKDASPRFVALDVDARLAERQPWSPTNPQAETPDRQFTRMGDEARRIREILQAGPASTSSP